MFKILSKKWLTSKHFYNDNINLQINDNLIKQFTLKNNQYLYLKNRTIFDYFLGNINFIDLSAEKKFGSKLYQELYKQKSPTSNWSTKISEGFCKELLCYIFETKISACKNDKELHIRLDLQSQSPDFKNFFEIKSRTFKTTGTAGEKILGTPKKYSKVFLKYKIPLYIILLGYQENEAIEKFDLFNLNPQNELHQNDIKLMDLYHNDLHINYLRGSDLIKLAFIKFKNDSKQFELITNAIRSETDLKNDELILNMKENNISKITNFVLSPGPFLKWVGGKNQIIEQVLNIFPKNINNYNEIFLGGGSVLLGLLQKNKNNSINVTGEINAFDSNELLITTYQVLQSTPKKLIKFLEKISNEYHSISTMKGDRKVTNLNDAKKSKESYYYYSRNLYNNEIKKEKSNKIKIAAYLIFLNKTGFRGLYRTGPNGFNVPFGHYKKPKIFNQEQLLEISKLIKNVKFKVADFEDSLKSVEKNDFVYLDPPYVPEQSTSFTKYTSKDFDITQHKKLFEMTKELTSKNIGFVMSNSNVSIVTDTFSNYLIKELDVKRTINSKNPGAKTKEVLIKGNIKIKRKVDLVV